MTCLFVHTSRIEAPAAEVFAWHEKPEALEKLTPPWEPVIVEQRPSSLKDGAQAVLRIKILGPLSMRWVAEHKNYIEGLQFCDKQVQGPFGFWEHTHRFEPDGTDACMMQDRIEYSLPLGFLTDWIGKSFVEAKLKKMFDYRHKVVAQAFAKKA